MPHTILGDITNKVYIPQVVPPPLPDRHLFWVSRLNLQHVMPQAQVFCFFVNGEGAAWAYATPSFQAGLRRPCLDALQQVRSLDRRNAQSSDPQRSRSTRGALQNGV